MQLTTSFINKCKGLVDDLINNHGKTCRLVYPSKMVDCTNCSNDPIGTKSGSTFRHGGPTQMYTLCHYCNGSKKVSQEQTENIKMLCYWNPKEWSQVFSTLNIVDVNGSVMTKGFLTDLPKVKKCEEVIIQTPIENYIHYKFKLAGEPVDTNNILQGRYFYAIWQRI